jgi:DNA polymerase III subunit gamma/tau
VSYVVLARKYRPQSFADLVGQSHVAKTLANAIAAGRVAHAFLFTGVRGVGKTTSARLLAKCLNCVGKQNEVRGPTATPCQECSPCQEIAAGSDIDVQEIDGASYNGVDEVRRLQEGLNFRPARDRFKVYIVDEVHMLSNAAWNAFLKTLEEPPPHVKFIFATTEVHKVPVTILSRCQRYDFRLIPTATVAERLREVLAKENIAHDEVSIATLAREAAGSMRDAMSLLDQVIAFSGEKLTGEDVTRVLGVPNRKVLHDLAAGLVAGDASSCLARVDELSNQGFDLAHVTKDFLRHLRNLVVSKVAGEAARPLLDLADEEVKDVEDLARRSEADDLMRLYQGFSRGYDDVVRSGQPRMALEMTLIRLSRRPPLIPLDELLARLGELEKRLGGGPTSPPRGGGPSPGARDASLDVSGLRSAGRASAPATTMPQGGTTVARFEPQTGLTSGALALAEPAPPPLAPMTVAPALPDEVTPTPPPTSAVSLKEPRPAEGEGPADDAVATFRRILGRVSETQPALASIFEHASVVELNRARAVLAFEAHSFAGAQAREPEALDNITRAVRAYFGGPTEVVLDLSARAHGDTVASAQAAERKDWTEKAKISAAAHPLVREALRLFEGELLEVRLREEEE